MAQHDFLAMVFRKLNTKTRINLIIQCLAMLVGTTTHWIWIINNGLLSENDNGPVLSRLFWDSLAFLDPIAALLLILKPRIGIWLTAIIIVADVLHNGTICIHALLSEPVPIAGWIKDNWMLWCQLLFACFVIASFKNNRIEIKTKEFKISSPGE